MKKNFTLTAIFLTAFDAHVHQRKEEEAKVTSPDIKGLKKYSGTNFPQVKYSVHRAAYSLN